MNVKAEDLAFGHWPEILCARGIDSSYFSGRPGPCPLCRDGRDRFQWKSNAFGGAGGYVCRVCGTGGYQTGFTLLMRHMGYTMFKQAADDVRDYFGEGRNIAPIQSVPAQNRWDGSWTPEAVASSVAKMRAVWERSSQIVEGDPVHRYMQRRSPGLEFDVLQGLRICRDLEYWTPPMAEGGRPALLGRFPAMIAAALDPNGDLVQIHKTYLTPDGYKADVPIVKKTERGIGVNSFAVRMVEPVGDTLGICEGVETGWGAMRYQQVPVWPCLNGPAMSEFVLPEYLRGQIKKLIIFADADELKRCGTSSNGQVRMRRPGSSYAEKAAAIARNLRLKVLVIRPAKTGQDFEDFFNHEVKRLVAC